MTKIKKVFIFIALFIFIIINCGYSNVTELEDRDFIIAIGIDRKDENKFDITVFSADMNYFQNKSSTSNKKYITCACADNINNGLYKINKRLKKNMYLGHTQIIFLNKSLLQNKKISSKIAIELENNTELNQKVKLIFVNNAQKFIKSHFSPDLLDYIKNKLDKKA